MGLRRASLLKAGPFIFYHKKGRYRALQRAQQEKNYLSIFIFIFKILYGLLCYVLYKDGWLLLRQQKIRASWFY